MLQPRFDGMLDVLRRLPHSTARLFQGHENVALEFFVGTAAEKRRVLAAIPAGRRFASVVVSGERPPRAIVRTAYRAYPVIADASGFDDDAAIKKRRERVAAHLHVLVPQLQVSAPF